jgi:uncharacterized membrane protein
MLYLISSNTTWFWLIIIISISTTLSIVKITEQAIPYVYIRYILGSILILFLPGFSLIKILFPKDDIDEIERVALGIGVSLAMVPFIGFILNYTPWKISLISLSISLQFLIITLAIIGLYRDYFIIKKIE